MTETDISAAASRLSDLVERAVQGEDIALTRRGKRVAGFAPLLVEARPERVHALVMRIRKSRAGSASSGSGSIRDMVEDGRR